MTSNFSYNLMARNWIGTKFISTEYVFEVKIVCTIATRSLPSLCTFVPCKVCPKITKFMKRNRVINWGREMHICIGNPTTIGLDDGLLPVQHQAIIWTNWTIANELQWNSNQNSYIFIQENVFENVVWKMVAILSWPQHVTWHENEYGSIQCGLLTIWWFYP